MPKPPPSNLRASSCVASALKAASYSSLLTSSSSGVSTVISAPYFPVIFLGGADIDYNPIEVAELLAFDAKLAFLGSGLTDIEVDRTLPFFFFPFFFFLRSASSLALRSFFRL